MKDYARIATKIRETPWLITETSLQVILEIVDARMNGSLLDEAEMIAKLEAVDPHPDTQYDNALVRDGIGVIPIMGPIFGKANLFTMMSGGASTDILQSDLQKMVADDSIRSILLHIDSPGGTADGIIETANAIRAAKEVKPIYALADSQAGSAAYWLMSQATQGYSTMSGGVGSIGVYTVHTDQSRADEQAGRRFSFISAGKYKTEGNPHEPLSSEAKEYRQEVVDEIYADFIDGVAEGRGVTADTVLSDYGQGRMLTSKAALDVGMIDGITTFDSLVGNMAELNSARPVQLFVSGEHMDKTFAQFLDSSSPVEVFHRGGRVYVGGNGIMAEHKWEEHSEPGTGSPPQPRFDDEDGRNEPDITSGSRRDPLPLDQDDPNAPKAKSKGGDSILTPEQIAEVYRLCGLSAPAADASHDDLMDTLRSRLGGLNERQRKFAEDYPDEFAEMQKQKSQNIKNNASKFVSSLGRFKRQVGEDVKDTNFGLSGLALSAMEELYVKFAEGNASLEDFEGFVTALMNGAVEFGERGSNLTDGEEAVTFDLSTMSGVKQARMLFAAKVEEVQAEEGCDYDEALQKAAKKYPELAQAYATGHVR